MERRQTTIYVVDDDPSVRRALRRLFASVGFQVEVFGSAEELLASSLKAPCCAILDVHLEGMSGVECGSLLRARRPPVPFVLISGHGDRTLQSLASVQPTPSLLRKPFEEHEVLTAIHRELDTDS